MYNTQETDFRPVSRQFGLYNPGKLGGTGHKSRNSFQLVNNTLLEMLAYWNVFFLANWVQRRIQDVVQGGA